MLDNMRDPAKAVREGVKPQPLVVPSDYPFEDDFQDDSGLLANCRSVYLVGIPGSLEIVPGKVFVNGEERTDIQPAALTVEEAEAQGMFKAVDFTEPEAPLHHKVRHMHANLPEGQRCCVAPNGPCCWP